MHVDIYDYMEEKLLVKEEEDKIKQKEAHSNLFLFCMLGVGGISYGVLMGLIYYDIHHMNENLDKLMDITNSAFAFASANSNATAMEGLRYSLNEISDCVIHKYCRHVPE